MRTKLFALPICALLLSSAVVAKVRQIPDSAQHGSITHVQDTVVEIDGKRLQLSAGARIRSQDNLIMVPMGLPIEALVKYQLDGSGQIHRVWLLTPEEAAAPDRKRE